MTMRFTHGVLLAGALACALSAPALADQSSPDVQTTAALLQAGGGPSAFSGKTLVKFLSGTTAQYQAEVGALIDKFGADNVKSFLDVLTFVFDGAANQIPALKNANSNAASDSESLAEAFYKDGMTDDGFSTTSLLDKLFGEDLHASISNAVTAKYGAKANANFEAVLSQTMSDMKAGYDL